MTTNHSVLDQEERRIHSHLLRMGQRTCLAIERSLDSLKRRDKRLAQQIIDEDSQINEFLHILEQECLHALGCEPTGDDLRNIVASLQIASELECIADHAADIAKIVLRMDDGLLASPMGQIACMGDATTSMLGRLMEAYDNCDQELARTIAEEDDELDAMEEQLIEELLGHMACDPLDAARGTQLLLISRSLERIGDRMAHIAERVVFMVAGYSPDFGQ